MLVHRSRPNPHCGIPHWSCDSNNRTLSLQNQVFKQIKISQPSDPNQRSVVIVEAFQLVVQGSVLSYLWDPTKLTFNSLSLNGIALPTKHETSL